MNLSKIYQSFFKNKSDILNEINDHETLNQILIRIYKN